MRKLYRSRDDYWLAGLCGGAAKVYDIDPSLLRLGVVLVCLVTAILPVVITYIVGWIIVPVESEGPGGL